MAILKLQLLLNKKRIMAAIYVVHESRVNFKKSNIPISRFIVVIHNPEGGGQAEGVSRGKIL
jgi:hypothetical protein